MKKLAGILATLLAAAGLVTATPAAAANGNLVNFGDSIAADAPIGPHTMNRIERIFRYGLGIPGKGCLHSETNYAHQTAHRLGLDIADFSCSGATTVSNGPKFFDQVDEALAAGVLNANTKRVLITQGFNDTYNLSGWGADQLRGAYVAQMRPQIDRIRAAAPNARIQIIGYLPITDAGRVCISHVLPSGPEFAEFRKIPFPVAADWENKAQWMNIDLANATGTEFIDLKALAGDHGMCAADHLRWFSGLADFTAGANNMPLHVNAKGHTGIAEIIARS